MIKLLNCVLKCTRTRVCDFFVLYNCSTLGLVKCEAMGMDGMQALFLGHSTSWTYSTNH